ncbi:MAG: sigma factor-like helix-turn-helix DNA-binding protein [Crocosphaera sp.]
MELLNIEFNHFSSDIENFSNLKPNQQQCLIKMFQGLTIRDIARDLEINESTIYHWLGQDAFQDCLRQWQQQLYLEVRHRIRSLSLKALDELERIIFDENVATKEKLRAIELVLKTCKAD